MGVNGYDTDQMEMFSYPYLSDIILIHILSLYTLNLALFILYITIIC